MEGLYHCTTYKSLIRILESGAFHPSYCLETASYLPSNPNFAFAMVCFADLQEFELKDHMSTFSSDVYIKMKKSWAFRHNISPVLYYSEKSTTTNKVFKSIASYLVDHIEQKDDLYNAVNILMGFMKQYKGHYYDKKRKEISSSEKTFYLEREWRYIPLVKNFEAYFLEETAYRDVQMREQKRAELIEHGYIVDFCWDDIMEIGVNQTYETDIISSLTSIFSISHSEATSKVKTIEFE